MITTATHGWHCHTVSGERWLVLKSQYVRRCGAQLGREHVASVARLAAQADAAARVPAEDSHLPHN